MSHIELKNAEKSLNEHKYVNAINIVKDLDNKLHIANNYYKARKEGQDIPSYQVRNKYDEVSKTYLKTDEYDRNKIKELTSTNKNLNRLDNHIIKIEQQEVKKELEMKKELSHDRGMNISF